MDFLESKSYNEYYKVDFIKRLSIIAFIISVVGLVVNFFIGFGIILFVIPGISMLFYFSIFLIANNKNLRVSNKVLTLLLTVYTLIILNFLWFFNYGSYGPAIYFFVIIYGVLLFMWHGNSFYYISAIFIVNVIVLFIIEYYDIIEIPNYETDNKRLIDVYSGLLFYSLLIALMFVYVKKRIFQEYKSAKKSDKLKLSFLQNISHEIRTPLNGIIGNAELIVSSELPEEVKENMIKVIKKDTHILLNNLDSIIDASKLFTHNIDVNKKSFNFIELINEILKDYSNILSNSDLRINYKSDFEHLILYNDRTLLSNCIRKILDNSINFTQSGEIKFETKYDEKTLKIIIIDQGPGIKEKYLDKVFEPHFKIEENIKNIHRGLGLGLFYVKSVCELIGAKVNLTSKYGEFTRVEIRLNKK